MKKKTIKILTIIIIILMFSTNILKIYASEISWVPTPSDAKDDFSLMERASVIIVISELVQIVLLLISLLVTIIEKIKSKNIKSLSLRIWVILATLFLFFYNVAKMLRINGIGSMVMEPEEEIQRSKSFIKTLIVLHFAVYAILTIMILIPIKKMKKYKKDDKLTKEENIKND